MEEKDKNKESGNNRDEKGKFKKGSNPNPNGRPKETEETKAKKKALKIIVKEYIDSLADELPNISPVLLKKAKGGDILAIKEVHDRVMGKAPQTMDVTSGGKTISSLVGEIRE